MLSNGSCFTSFCFLVENRQKPSRIINSHCDNVGQHQPSKHVCAIWGDRVSSRAASSVCGCKETILKKKDCANCSGKDPDNGYLNTINKKVWKMCVCHWKIYSMLKIIKHSWWRVSRWRVNRCAAVPAHSWWWRAGWRRRIPPSLPPSPPTVCHRTHEAAPFRHLVAMGGNCS